MSHLPREEKAVRPVPSFELWRNPMQLQQRLRSIVVQVLLLSSVEQPMTIKNLIELLEKPFCTPSVDGISNEAAKPFYVLDEETRLGFVGARCALLYIRENTATAHSNITNTNEDDRHGERSSSKGEDPFFHAQLERTLLLPEPLDALKEEMQKYELLSSSCYSSSTHPVAPSTDVLLQIGKAYMQHYYQSILGLHQLVYEDGRDTCNPSMPPVTQVLRWMIYGLCLSDPYFRLVVNPWRGTLPLALPRIVYPGFSSLLLFNWDLEEYWIAAKAHCNRKGKKDAHEIEKKRGFSSGIVYRPPALLIAALHQHYSTPLASRWSVWHSLYYLTSSSPLLPAAQISSLEEPSVASEELELFSVFQAPYSSGKQPRQPLLEEKEWRSLVSTWFRLIDKNLPDNFGDAAMESSLSGRICTGLGGSTSGCDSSDSDSRENKIGISSRRLYNEMPHVGCQEHLYGSVKFQRFLHRGSSLTITSSSSTVSASQPSGTSFRFLLYQLFTHHLFRQNSPGGGFHRGLQLINTRFLGDLGMHFFLSPISIPRLASLLQWHSEQIGGTKTGMEWRELFRQHSLLYFLLWVAGSPSMHRIQQRQLKNAAVREELRDVFSSLPDKRKTRGLVTTREENGFLHALKSSSSLWEKHTHFMEEEQKYFHLLEDRALVFTPPVTVDLFAFFVVRSPDSGTPNSEEKKALLSSIRGVKLRTLSVLNTLDATPMEIWKALELRFLPLNSAAPSDAEPASFSPSHIWAELEPHIWCIPYSVLKHRLVRVALAWCRYNSHSSFPLQLTTEQHAMCEESSAGAHASPTLTIGEWVEALLWDQEYGVVSPCIVSAPSTACEMLFSLVALADPEEHHFKVFPPKEGQHSETLTAEQYHVTLIDYSLPTSHCLDGELQR